MFRGGFSGAPAPDGTATVSLWLCVTNISVGLPVCSRTSVSSQSHLPSFGSNPPARVRPPGASAIRGTRFRRSESHQWPPSRLAARGLGGLFDGEASGFASHGFPWFANGIAFLLGSSLMASRHSADCLARCSLRPRRPDAKTAALLSRWAESILHGHSSFFCSFSVWPLYRPPPGWGTGAGDIHRFAHATGRRPPRPPPAGNGRGTPPRPSSGPSPRPQTRGSCPDNAACP